MSYFDICKNFLFEYSVILNLALYSLGLWIVFCPFKKTVKGILWSLAQLLILIVFECAFDMGLDCIFANYLPFNNFFSFAFLITHAVSTLLYASLIGKYHYKASISMGLSYFVTCCLLHDFSHVIPTLVNSLENAASLDVIFRFTCMIFFIPFAVYIRLLNLNKINSINNTSFIFLNTYHLVELALLIYIVWDVNYFEEITLCTFAISVMGALLIINVLSHYMTFDICETHEKVLQMEVKNTELEKNEEMLRMSEENLIEMRQIRHDTKNQYGIMKIMLQEKRYDELEKYFEEYGDGIIEPLSFIECENRNLSAVLNMEFTKARSLGINFDVRVAVPNELPFTSVELCSLFTNLLDNAMEGCIRYNIEKPVISIKVMKYQEFFSISISNPVPDGIKIEDIIKNRTSKKDKVLHGHGTRIVEDIVRHYDGVFKRKIEDNKFIVDILMGFNLVEEEE